MLIFGLYNASILAEEFGNALYIDNDQVEFEDFSEYCRMYVREKQGKSWRQGMTLLLQLKGELVEKSICNY